MPASEDRPGNRSQRLGSGGLATSSGVLGSYSRYPFFREASIKIRGQNVF
jgi:hypothetical protein